MSVTVHVGDIKIGGANPIVLIAGPCVIESKSATLRAARLLKEIASRHGFPLIFKSSYDKANRTSRSSFRGPGIEKGLAVLRRIKDELGLKVLSDIHCREEIRRAAKVLDVIQIPAFLCRQTDLIAEAAATGLPVNIKKGQFLAPWDMEHVIAKAASKGNKAIMVTDRGVSFGYNNLVSDLRSIIIMKKFGYPVIYDATHSVQMPGGLGDRSGGGREFVPYLALASAVCGTDGIFMEVHEDPDLAKSDGPNMLPLGELDSFLGRLARVERAVKTL